MARRSAANERYGKHTAPSGKTRKSAAAAKPKRANAAAPPKPAKSSRPGRPAPAKREPMVYHPDTADYKLWRRIWWGFLGAAIVLTTVSWFVMRAGAQYQTIGTVILAFGYLSIGAALYLDWTKLRKIRAEWIRSGKAAEAGKAAEKARVTSEKKVSRKVTMEETTTETVTHEPTDKS